LRTELGHAIAEEGPGFIGVRAAHFGVDWSIGNAAAHVMPGWRRRYNR
jgi:hypothetical protein